MREINRLLLLSWEHLPVGSVLPKTDVKLLSETNAFVAAAEETVEPLKPILWFFMGFFFIVVCVGYRIFIESCCCCCCSCLLFVLGL